MTAMTFTQKVATACSLVVATILLLFLLYYTFDVVMLVFAAALLAIFLSGLAEVIEPYIPLGDGLRVLLVSVILLAVVGITIALLSPSIAEQGQHLREELPKSAVSVADYLNQYGWGRALIEQLPTFDQVKENINVSSLLSGVGGVFTSTMGAVGNVAIVVLLAIYLASEPRFYTEGFVRLFPIPRRQRVTEILHQVYETLRWWLIGKFGSMLFIGFLTWVGLSILGVPIALTLGLIAGLLSFIPNFGPILSAIPALLIAFVDSPITAVYVLILYIGVQIIESNIITPLIERETVELPPALTVVFQLGLGTLVGGLGLVLATPLLAMIVVVVQLVYLQDILGDKVEGLLSDEIVEDKPAPEPSI
ncbi:MAG TPA: AI-2E family transporter [Pyrinomonadaceae bacterium]|nr:AI-2E family transporter [Pyrinomonadaceae bacterium]